MGIHKTTGFCIKAGKMIISKKTMELHETIVKDTPLDQLHAIFEPVHRGQVDINTQAQDKAARLIADVLHRNHLSDTEVITTIRILGNDGRILTPAHRNIVHSLFELLEPATISRYFDMIISCKYINSKYWDKSTATKFKKAANKIFYVLSHDTNISPKKRIFASLWHMQIRMASPTQKAADYFQRIFNHTLKDFGNKTIPMADLPIFLNHTLKMIACKITGSTYPMTNDNKHDKFLKRYGIYVFHKLLHEKIKPEYVTRLAAQLCTEMDIYSQKTIPIAQRDKEASIFTKENEILINNVPEAIPDMIEQAKKEIEATLRVGIDACKGTIWYSLFQESLKQEHGKQQLLFKSIITNVLEQANPSRPSNIEATLENIFGEIRLGNKTNKELIPAIVPEALSVVENIKLQENPDEIKMTALRSICDQFRGVPEASLVIIKLAQDYSKLYQNIISSKNIDSERKYLPISILRGLESSIKTLLDSQATYPDAIKACRTYLEFWKMLNNKPNDNKSLLDNMKTNLLAYQTKLS